MNNILVENPKKQSDAINTLKTQNNSPSKNELNNKPTEKKIQELDVYSKLKVLSKNYIESNSYFNIRTHKRTKKRNKSFNGNTLY